MTTNTLTETQPLPLQERDQLLNEYSEAVHLYERTVMELQKARERSATGNFPNLLAEADAAKSALDCCRDRYQNYRALVKASGN